MFLYPHSVRSCKASSLLPALSLAHVCCLCRFGQDSSWRLFLNRENSHQRIVSAIDFLCYAGNNSSSFEVHFFSFNYKLHDALGANLFLKHLLSAYYVQWCQRNEPTKDQRHEYYSANFTEYWEHVWYKNGHQGNELPLSLRNSIETVREAHFRPYGRGDFLRQRT